MLAEDKVPAQQDMHQTCRQLTLLVVYLESHWRDASIVTVAEMRPIPLSQGDRKMSRTPTVTSGSRITVTTRHLSFMLLAAAVLVAALSHGVAVADKPTSSPFEVRYRLSTFQHPEGSDTWLSTLNNVGIACGGVRPGHGCLVDSETGAVCWDVRDLVPSPYSENLRPFILTVNAISDSGRITGSIHLADGTVLWGYVLDTQNDVSNEGMNFLVIDETVLPGVTKTMGVGVNDAGRMLGVSYEETPPGGPADPGRIFVLDLVSMQVRQFSDLPVSIFDVRRYGPFINNLGQVAGELTSGEGFRFTPGASPSMEYFPTGIDDFEIICFTDLNDSGVVAGIMWAPKSFKAKRCPYRIFDTPADDIPFPIDIEQNRYHAVSINESCDLLVTVSFENEAVYHDSTDYLFMIEDLVVVDDVDTPLWEARDREQGLGIEDMANRYPCVAPDTVGQLCGTLNYETGKGGNKVLHHVGVVLTPEYANE